MKKEKAKRNPEIEKILEIFEDYRSGKHYYDLLFTEEYGYLFLASEGDELENPFDGKLDAHIVDNPDEFVGFALLDIGMQESVAHYKGTGCKATIEEMKEHMKEFFLSYRSILPQYVNEINEAEEGSARIFYTTKAD